MPNYFDARERNVVPDLLQRRRIRFLTTVDFPPFNFLDQTGKLAGFNVDLAREICSELDITSDCQMQALPFDELLPALRAGRGDAIIAGIAITSDSRRSLAFSRTYMKFPARFIRNREVALGGTDAQALAARRVGVMAGSVHEVMLRSWFPDTKPVVFEREDWLRAAVRDKSVDAAFGDGMRLSFWMSSQDAANCCSFFDGPYLSDTYFGEGLAIAASRENPQMIISFDHALIELARKGVIADLYRRYFPRGLY